MSSLDSEPNVACHCNSRLVERVTRNADRKRLTDVVFLDMTKAFGTVWFDNLVYNLAALNVKIISFFRSRQPYPFVACGLAWHRTDIPPLQSVRQLHTPTRHVYADDTTIMARSRNSVLLFSYLESYLSLRERWLREWSVAINVSKSTATLSVTVRRRIQKPCCSGNQSYGSILPVI